MGIFVKPFNEGPIITVNSNTSTFISASLCLTVWRSATRPPNTFLWMTQSRVSSNMASACAAAVTPIWRRSCGSCSISW